MAQSEEEAIAAVEDMLSGNGFGEAGHKVVIEEFLQGEEASFICLCDGKPLCRLRPPKITRPATMVIVVPTLAVWVLTRQPR